MAYIYGVSVQGIQGYIFQTNKLKEIVGASQLVENICTTEFEKFCRNKNHIVSKDNIIMAAAGNIRYVIDDEVTADKIVKYFPMHVTNYAPGVRIIQALVEINGDFVEAKKKLEKRLSIQKNIISIPRDTGFMGLERARRTGGVAFDFDKDKKHRDNSNSRKADTFKSDPISLFKKFKGNEVRVKQVPYDIDEITRNNENGWLAIIHADGNNLGSVVSKLVTQNALADFSDKLEQATQEAVQSAFEQEIPNISEKEKYPIRPVILGGDDMTIIIRADLAFNFATAYLKAFERKTNELLGTKLTACAGIAYIKQSYPFHYGVHLAESLTKEAKKASKSIPNAPSSLSFYKVQASFTGKLEDMQKRTHRAKAAGKSFNYGPYFLHPQEGKPSIQELEDKLDVLEKFKDDKSKGISKLRNWLSELHKDNAKADFLMDRMQLVNDKFYDKLDLDKERKSDKIIIKDLLELDNF